MKIMFISLSQRNLCHRASLIRRKHTAATAIGLFKRIPEAAGISEMPGRSSSLQTQNAP
jgi:hypothetical protein